MRVQEVQGQMLGNGHLKTESQFTLGCPGLHLLDFALRILFTAEFPL